MTPFPTPGRAQSLEGLIRLQGSATESLFGAAAVAYNLMVAAAAGDGVTLRAVSGHRTNAEQWALYIAKGPYHPTANPDGAAVPGTSNHERGKSVDISVVYASHLAWLRGNAARFLFRNDVATEPWHWTFTLDDMGVVRDGRLAVAPPELAPLLGADNADRPIAVLTRRGDTLASIARRYYGRGATGDLARALHRRNDHVPRPRARLPFRTPLLLPPTLLGRTRRVIDE